MANIIYMINMIKIYLIYCVIYHFVTLLKGHSMHAHSHYSWQLSSIQRTTVTSVTSVQY